MRATFDVGRRLDIPIPTIATAVAASGVLDGRLVEAEIAAFQRFWQRAGARRKTTVTNGRIVT